jgi:hypothetical protein
MPGNRCSERNRRGFSLSVLGSEERCLDKEGRKPSTFATFVPLPCTGDQPQKKRGATIYLGDSDQAIFGIPT